MKYPAPKTVQGLTPDFEAMKMALSKYKRVNPKTSIIAHSTLWRNVSVTGALPARVEIDLTLKNCMVVITVLHNPQGSNGVWRFGSVTT